MDYKYINLFLIFVIIVLLVMNYNVCKENFAANQNNLKNKIANAVASQGKATDPASESYFETDYAETDYVQDSEALKKMFAALSNSEHLCDELEKHQKNKDLIEQANINERTLNEIANRARIIP